MLNIKLKRLFEKVKALHGDPHYVAMGMAIGIFIGVTPSMPFHTILAITLALAFRASKPAAILGIWISNPLTAPFLYVAAYKTGYLFFEESHGGLASIYRLVEQLEGDGSLFQKLEWFSAFLTDKLSLLLVMNIGGALLALPCGIAAYWGTRKLLERRKKRKSNPRKE